MSGSDKSSDNTSLEKRFCRHLVEMTSVLRRYSLIEPRIQYFTVMTLNPIDGWVLNPAFASSPVMDVSSFVAAFVYIPNKFTGQHLLKDLGRQITVYDSNTTGSPHVAVFRQVMEVNGPGVEGISSNIGYICVWTDGPSPIFLTAPVGRTG